jgi:transketolase
VEVFDEQPEDYRESVLPAAVTARVSVEAGVSDYWYKFVGAAGRRLGVDRFGASAPYKEVYAHFGLTPENVAAAARAVIAG